MNFQSMDYFLMTASKRSFSKAAEELHITQQTLSSHIAGLERELGTRLFIRHVPLELTYGGEMFLKYAQDFQLKYRMMQQEFGDISDCQRGELKIGIAPTRSRVLLPDLVEEFERKYPKISIKFMGSTNEEVLQDLQEGNTDLAVANFPDQLPGIAVREFYEEEVVLLISKDLFDRLYGQPECGKKKEFKGVSDLKMFSDCPFLLSNKTDVTGKIGRNLIRMADFHPVIKAQSDDVEMLLKLCVKGIGACFCPEYLAEGVLSKEQAAGLYILKFGRQASYPICFGWRESSYQWSVIEKFVNIAKFPHSSIDVMRGRVDSP